MKNPSRWSKSQAEHSDLLCGLSFKIPGHARKHLQIGILQYFLESRSQESEKKQFKHV